MENVPVDEDEASESRTALSERKGSIAFTTTHWSVVLQAQGQSPAAQEALERLCHTYWRPVYSFIRREGTGTEEAEDLTQSFFALLLGAQELRCCSQRERTFAFLSADVAQTFSSQ